MVVASILREARSLLVLTRSELAHVPPPPTSSPIHALVRSAPHLVGELGEGPLQGAVELLVAALQNHAARAEDESPEPYENRFPDGLSSRLVQRRCVGHAAQVSLPLNEVVVSAAGRGKRESHQANRALLGTSTAGWSSSKRSGGGPEQNGGVSADGGDGRTSIGEEESRYSPSQTLSQAVAVNTSSGLMSPWTGTVRIPFDR